MWDVESYPITITDLDGSLLNIAGVRETLKTIPLEDSNKYIDNPSWIKLYWLFDEHYGWLKNKDNRYWYPPANYFVTLITTDGEFVFAFDSHNGIFDQAVWWIADDFKGEFTTGLVRLLPDRRWPMLVVINENTGLCALELGTYSKQDDDPNMRGSTDFHLRWDPGDGFESKYLVPEVPTEGEPVEMKSKSRRFGPGSTPKHTGHGSRGSRKNRFNR